MRAEPPLPIRSANPIIERTKVPLSSGMSIVVINLICRMKRKCDRKRALLSSIWRKSTICDHAGKLSF